MRALFTRCIPYYTTKKIADKALFVILLQHISSFIKFVNFVSVVVKHFEKLKWHFKGYKNRLCHTKLFMAVAIELIK